MRLRFPGTGYGLCPLKKSSGHEFRRPACLQIDDKILIDPTEPTFDFYSDFNLTDELSSVTDVLITHSHPSHFSPEALLKLSERRTVRVWGNAAVLSKIPDSLNLALCPVEPFSVSELPSGYRIIPMPASHKTDLAGEMCLHYAVSRDKTVFYGVDGGLLRTDVFDLLKHLKFDAFVADAALGDAEPTGAYMYHNSLQSADMQRRMLLSEGILGEKSRFILTHLPMKKKEFLHEVFSEKAGKLGLTVAYDGYFAAI
ncbi:MAG: MBL fold metallo-hydrolase [Clostridia bacterium]|nr:MBL fold metallo-hydrolase [Clostridia bacterium]